MVKLVGVIGGGEDKDKGSEGGEGMGRVACLARRQFPLVRERYGGMEKLKICNTINHR